MSQAMATAAGTATLPDVNGTWSVTLHEPEGAVTETISLAQDAETVVLTQAEGPLVARGIYRNGLLRLSAFTGTLTRLAHARAMPDGTLRGMLWRETMAPIEWTARRPDTR
jgi:hypothetical protein